MRTLGSMNSYLALILSVVFVVLALWHFRMALLPGSGTPSAVPSVEGKPLFVPSRAATVAVAVVLLLFAGLVAATSGVIAVGLPQGVLRGLSFVLAAGLLARAVGEFKYVGLFKRVRGSRFATLDTFVYSPLCLVLSVGVALVALHNGA
jgi:uncharacterized protein DUF3995